MGKLVALVVVVVAVAFAMGFNTSKYVKGHGCIGFGFGSGSGSGKGSSDSNSKIKQNTCPDVSLKGTLILFGKKTVTSQKLPELLKKAKCTGIVRIYYDKAAKYIDMKKVRSAIEDAGLAPKLVGTP